MLQWILAGKEREKDGMSKKKREREEGVGGAVERETLSEGKAFSSTHFIYKGVNYAPLAQTLQHEKQHWK